MEAALDNNAIAQEQHSRPSRTFIDHAVNRRLTIDHHQSKRMSLALAMSDLKGCYDRIIHNAAALALLRIGVPKAKIHSMFDTIQRMVHRIRTAFGDSTEYVMGPTGKESIQYPHFSAFPRFLSNKTPRSLLRSRHFAFNTNPTNKPPKIIRAITPQLQPLFSPVNE